MGTLSDDNARRVGINPTGLHEGGGLPIWDTETEYITGAVVLDRDGIWKATGTNTDSRPVSGNTDWELVGGTPYMDVQLDPPQIGTAPFYDPDQSGPGVVAIAAPGEGLFIFVTAVVGTVNKGEDFGNQTDLKVTWVNTAGDNIFGGASVNDGLDDGTPYISTPEYGPHPTGTAIASIVNSPVVISTTNQLVTGTRAVNFRLYYKIESAVSTFPATEYFVISAVDQGTETFSIAGDHRDLAGAISVVGSTGNDGDYTVVSVTPNPPSSPRVITSVDIGSPSVTIAGDHTDEFSEFGGKCVIQGSPSNDGNYDYTGRTFDTDHTDIFLAGSLVDGTAGGTVLALAVNTDIVTVEPIPDDTADGWVKQ